MAQTIPVTAEETRLSLKALRDKLVNAYLYSYGYSGTPEYIKLQIASISFRVVRLVAAVAKLETQCPAKFYRKRQQ